MRKLSFVFLVFVLLVSYCYGFRSSSLQTRLVTSLHRSSTINPTFHRHLYYDQDVTRRKSILLNAVTTTIESNGSEIQTVVELEQKKPSAAWQAYLRATEILTTLFPLWTVLFAGIALVKPESFSWFSTQWFTWSLGRCELNLLSFLSLILGEH